MEYYKLYILQFSERTSNSKLHFCLFIFNSFLTSGAPLSGIVGTFDTPIIKVNGEPQYTYREILSLSEGREESKVNVAQVFVFRSMF